MGVDGQRATILAAALRALAEKPYEQLSVEDVLRAAGVSRQTFYRCFPNKQALFHQIFRDGNALFLGAIATLDRSGDDPVTVADRALTGALSFVVHGGPALRALYRETIRPDGEFAPYRAEVFEAMVADIAGWARADLRLDVDELLVRAVLLAIERLMFELAERGTPSTADVERFRRMVHLLVDGVWRGLTDPAGR
ncbi:MAG: TetR/AcrR family transcriptional regulator [Deltaproteobacteria bacterium]|nr:TetR/AcrR family transcriptional regulator [Deltaproteobacteria bacterium]